MSAGQGIAAVARQFQFRGEISAIERHGNGHINDTWCVGSCAGGASTHYILQRINRNVFRDPAAVMQNIERVTAHLAAQVAGNRDAARRVLSRSSARRTAAPRTSIQTAKPGAPISFISNAHTCRIRDFSGPGSSGGSRLRPLSAATCRSSCTATKRSDS